MAGVTGQWLLRRFAPATDREQVEALWRAAMPPAWPLLPGGVMALREGLVAVQGTGLAAVQGTGLVGFAAVDMAGSIPLVLVAPACQRRGIGTALVTAAVGLLRAAGTGEVAAGRGGTSYIWPGVPLDLPAAVSFFAALGWDSRHDTLDLVADLADYRPPAGASERAAQAGVTITQATRSESGAVLAFESSTFPSWARWFEPSDQNILVARDREGSITGTLLFEGPGTDSVFLPLLGPAAGTIGCVGVAPHRQGQGIGTAMVALASEILRDAGTRTCHIGWTVRESFYARAGYHPWRRYRMFRRTTGQPATAP
jgi:ribosomal protein S18 acetylase RimI-like enzyme